MEWYELEGLAANLAGGALSPVLGFGGAAVMWAAVFGLKRYRRSRTARATPDGVKVERAATRAPRFGPLAEALLARLAAPDGWRQYDSARAATGNQTAPSWDCVYGPAGRDADPVCVAFGWRPLQFLHPNFKVYVDREEVGRLLGWRELWAVHKAACRLDRQLTGAARAEARARRKVERAQALITAEADRARLARQVGSAEKPVTPPTRPSADALKRALAAFGWEPVGNDCHWFSRESGGTSVIGPKAAEVLERWLAGGLKPAAGPGWELHCEEKVSTGKYEGQWTVLVKSGFDTAEAATGYYNEHQELMRAHRDRRYVAVPAGVSPKRAREEGTLVVVAGAA